MLKRPIPIEPSLKPLLLKLYGPVACGFPSPAEEFQEPSLSLDELCGIGKPSLFMLEAWGHSMTEMGVFDGDFLVVDRAKEPKIGSVVVARVNADFTVKIYSTEKGIPVLKPANPAFENIYIDEYGDAEIWGVVLWNLHKLHD